MPRLKSFKRQSAGKKNWNDRQQNDINESQRVDRASWVFAPVSRDWQNLQVDDLCLKSYFDNDDIAIVMRDSVNATQRILSMKLIFKRITSLYGHFLSWLGLPKHLHKVISSGYLSETPE